MRLGQKNRVPYISVQMEAAGWVAASLNSTWASQQVPGWAWTNNEQRILNKPNSILGYNTRRTMARRSREVISSYLCWWVYNTTQPCWQSAGICCNVLCPWQMGEEELDSQVRWWAMLISRNSPTTGKTSNSQCTVTHTSVLQLQLYCLLSTLQHQK